MRVVIAMGQLLRVVDEAVRRELRDTGLSPVDLEALAWLFERPGVSGTTISERTGRTRQNIQRTLESLERRGLVSRPIKSRRHQGSRPVRAPTRPAGRPARRNRPRIRQDRTVISLVHVARQRQEHQRLFSAPGADERPAGLGLVRFRAQCPTGAIRCLERVREVMNAILLRTSEWPSEEEWPALLPAWFVAACAPEQTQEEAERALSKWQALSPDAQARSTREERWSLLDWVYWMDPARRQWWWWDAIAINETTLRLAVEVEGWPFPWGALSWLLRASGATTVESEDE